MKFGRGGEDLEIELSLNIPPGEKYFLCINSSPPPSAHKQTDPSI